MCLSFKHIATTWSLLLHLTTCRSTPVVFPPPPPTPQRSGWVGGGRGTTTVIYVGRASDNCHFIFIYRPVLCVCMSAPPLSLSLSLSSSSSFTGSHNTSVRWESSKSSVNCICSPSSDYTSLVIEFLTFLFSRQFSY